MFKDAKIIVRPVDFKPTVTFGDYTYTAEEFKELRDKMTIKDRLNENQLNVLEDLKNVYKWSHSHILDLMYHLVERDEDMFLRSTIRAIDRLTEEEQAELVYAFSTWTMSCLA